VIPDYSEEDSVSEVSVKDDVRSRVEARMKELEPLVKEYDELRRIAAAIDTQEGQAATDGIARRTGRATPRRALRASGPGRGGHGARSEEARKLIAEKPGISVAELAEKMGIGTTYLYRLLPRLEREGALRKEGKGYHLA
jgi:Winged helix-turn-helix DNA-binding